MSVSAGTSEPAWTSPACTPSSMLVIKIGGSLTDVDPLLRDVAACREPLLLVHGGNKELNDLSTRLPAADGHVGARRGQPLYRRRHDGPFLDGLRGQAEQANRRALAGARRQRSRPDRHGRRD